MRQLVGCWFHFQFVQVHMWCESMVGNIVAMWINVKMSLHIRFVVHMYYYLSDFKPKIIHDIRKAFLSLISFPGIPY